MVNKKSEKASLLALANVEALAQGEIVVNPVTYNCWGGSHECLRVYIPGGSVLYYKFY